MWISRDPGRRPAIFHMLIRDNARRRWQNGECLIHGNPPLCGLHYSNGIRPEKFHGRPFPDYGAPAENAPAATFPACRWRRTAN
jgi:hypothetical protein